MTEETECYKCKRCGYKTNDISNFKKHLKKIKVCPPTLEDINVLVLFKEICKRSYDENDNKCLYCDKQFKDRKSIYRHVKVCKNSPSNQENLQKQIEQLKLEFEKFKHEKYMKYEKPKTDIPQLKLRNFGEENTAAIPDTFIRNIFLDLQYNTLFENLHCDPDYPENHNVRIKSTKRQLLEIYKNDIWNVTPFKIGLEEIYKKLKRIFLDYYDKYVNWVEEDMSKDEIDEVLEELDTELSSKISPIKNEFLSIMETHHRMLTHKENL